MSAQCPPEALQAPIAYPGKDWRAEFEKLSSEIYAVTGTSAEEDGRSPQDALKEHVSALKDTIEELREEIGELEDEKTDLEMERARYEGMPAFGGAREYLIAGRLREAIRALSREHPDLRDLEYLYERERGGGR